MIQFHQYFFDLNSLIDVIGQVESDHDPIVECFLVSHLEML